MSERDIRLYLVDILDSGNAVLAFVKDPVKPFKKVTLHGIVETFKK